MIFSPLVPGSSAVTNQQLLVATHESVLALRDRWQDEASEAALTKNPPEGALHRRPDREAAVSQLGLAPTVVPAGCEPDESSSLADALAGGDVDLREPDAWEPATFVLECEQRHAWGSHGRYQRGWHELDHPTCPRRGCGLTPLFATSYRGPHRPDVVEPTS